MEWHPCKVCGKAHPFKVTAERHCPNQSRGGGKNALPQEGYPKGACPVHPSTLVEGNEAARVASGPREPKRKVGRPLKKDKAKTLVATRPWEAEGLSRTTWYRRQTGIRK